MVKRERLYEDESEDGMRLIPDEILVLIFSLLSFKESTVTTTVARRWRYLHGCIRKLDLDGTESLCNLIYSSTSSESIGMPLRIIIPYQEYKQKYEDLKCKYIRWVVSVVSNHKGSLEEFRVVYSLDKSYTDLINSWLRFAVSRKVKKLELNLTPKLYPEDKPYGPYTFPYKNGFEFRFIRKLCTNWVNVNCEVVASFLRNCPLLEHLSVSHSLDLSSLEIINTFPSFKRLEIYLCYNLESLVIRDSNIVILKILLKKKRDLQQQIQFVVRNVPLLTEIWTADVSLHLFSTVLPQIEMLKLYIAHRCPEEDEVRSLGVEMRSLKQLVVVDENQNDDASLLHLVRLVLNGYVSRQFEILIHFVETGVALKNIVVDPRPLKRPAFSFNCGWIDFIQQTETSNQTLKMARALEYILPSNFNLTIL